MEFYLSLVMINDIPKVSVAESMPLTASQFDKLMEYVRRGDDSFIDP